MEREMNLPRIIRPLIGSNHTLGHPQIDREHLIIADWWMKAALCAPVALPFHIAGLRKAMREHFSREAALVEATGEPLCPRHRCEHDSMLALCDEAYRQSHRRQRAARALLRNGLPRLLRDHINSMDQIAVLIIRAAQNRATSLVQLR
jgi:hypothetical protein